MGQIVGTLGGVELGDPVQIRIVIERLERAIVDLQNARASQPAAASVNTVVYGPGVRFAAYFPSATSWIIAAATHGLDTRNIMVQCFDASMKWTVPDSITIDMNKTVTITWFTAQTGTVVLL